jgi:hypothetical protein
MTKDEKSPMKAGSTERVILHCEAQGHGGGNLAERMYHYKCLIYGHYRREPAAIAISTGKRPKDEPGHYSHNRYGTKTVYEYNNLVLPDLCDEELMASDNPIDLVLYAAKCSLESKKELRKYEYLRKSLELLGERGWSRDDKRDLLLFIERILYLTDKKLEAQYVEYRRQLRQEGKIVFIPMGEQETANEIRQCGIKEGIEKGKLEGKLEGKIEGKIEFARNLLNRGISPDIIAESSGLPREKIRELMN